MRPELGSRLLARRGEVRRLVTGNRELKWQGVPLADLEFNHGLTNGSDFGGRRTAAYLPAIDRYQGRFFQALGEAGKRKVREGKYVTVIVSGLYGLVLPSEGIQLYSCSLGSEVAETWERDSLLTDVLCDCIDRFNVLRVFDLLAIDAYRRRHRSKCDNSSLHTRAGLSRGPQCSGSGVSNDARARQRPWISAVSARADSRAA